MGDDEVVMFGGKKEKVASEQFQSKLQQQATRQTTQQLQPVLKEAPRPLQTAMQNPENANVVLDSVFKLQPKRALDAIVDVIRPIPSEEAELRRQLSSYFENHRGEFREEYYDARKEVATEAYVEDKAPRKVVLQMLYQDETIAIPLGLATPGTAVMDVAAAGEKKQKGWTSRNGQELLDLSREVGYSADTVLSIARYLDSTYSTNFADKMITNNHKMFDQIVRRLTTEIIRLDMTMAEMNRKDKNQKDQLEKLEIDRTARIEHLGTIVGEEHLPELQKIIKEGKKLDVLIASVVNDSEQQIATSLKKDAVPKRIVV